ncbi:tetratricopeptide repeat-containing sensor histidine kinase [Sinomicrobium weinanense]|uniref:histidine kinase n=1 Tax=Sinomicrobium weinanense TaxID=2842200 RepID=A0A926JRE6_9FLAO|nr:ATP-binding protein [Sinomicrobium weinanense]MBC9795897.1 ATP-binding protein [Sinomicrobium weinanense]MBU3124724.1 ATP-binding protein [Sinomicrobium weinanense]
MKFSFLALFIIIVFYAGCDENMETQRGTPEKVKDSAVYFFERSKENTLSTEEKLFFVNQFLAHVKDDHDPLVLKVLSQKIYLHNTMRQYDSSLYYTDELIKFSKVQEDTLYLAKGYYRKSKIFSYLSDLEESFKNAIESKKYYLAVGDSSQVGKRLVEMAIAQGRLGDYSGSQESATESLLYLDHKKDSLYLSGAYNRIAISYRGQELYDDAIKEYENALKFVASGKDSIVVLTNIANVRMDQKEFNSAIEIFTSIARKKGANSTKIKARIIDNLAYTRWLQNPGANVLAELEEALKIRLKNDDMEGLQASYAHLSDFFRPVNNALAVEYAKRYLDISTAYKNPEGRIRALEKLIHLAAPNESQLYAGQYTLLNDSLNTARLRVKNAFAKIKYDYSREEQQKLKYKTEKERTELLLKKEKTENLVLFMVVIGIGTISYLWYTLRKTREEARIARERQEAIYTTEIRLSKRVHDELANGVYHIMAQLGTGTPDKDILDKLEKIYMMTRDISRENTGVDTGARFPEELTSMLGSYSSGDTRIVILGLEDVSWQKVSIEKKVNLHRVLQELMTNMKKHSKATHVAITFSETAEKLKITYSDNGVGIPSGMLKYGNGLRNTENRILFVKGSITFDIEKGFRAEVQLPY